MKRLTLVLIFAAALVAGLRLTRSSPMPLGPADGHDLAAVDTGRVALGDVAPDFTLESRSGERITLSALRGRRVLLVFYRGHW